jgi:hypothetical protein
MNFKEKYPNGFVHGIISGHGGLKDGVYQIRKEGSKQAQMPDGKMIYEGEENRIIKDTLIDISKWWKDGSIQTIDLNPSLEDISLQRRVDIVNSNFNHFKTQGKLLLLWEIHNNAFNGEVEGTEVFHTKGTNFSDEMASIWIENVNKILPHRKIRRDITTGEKTKEKDFYIIKNIHTFGILMECFFFDNPKEVKKFCHPIGYRYWATSMLFAMRELNEKYYG